MAATNTSFDAQLEEAQVYLAKHRIKELYSKLVYELTMYRPNNPKKFIHERIHDMLNFKNSHKQDVLDPSAVPLPKRPQIIFMLGAPLSGKTTLAKRYADEFDMCYINLPTLDAIKAQIAQKMQEQASAMSFVIDDFPCTIQDLLAFEAQICECTFAILLNASLRVDDKRQQQFARSKTIVVHQYLQGLDKLNNTQDAQAVYMELVKHVTQ